MAINEPDTAILTDNAPDRAPRPRAKGRPIAFLIHSATGLWLTLLMCVVLVTGTLTVVHNEIDWLIYPEIRVAPGEERVNPGLLFDNALAARPESGISNLQSSVLRDRIAAQALISTPEGGFRRLWIDPYTGAVQGETPVLTIGAFIDVMHTTLFLPVIGRAFVNFFGVLTLISIVTGLIVYKKFWRGFWKRPRWDRGARTWLGDLHRLMALWTIWFTAIIGVTGTWWFYDTPLHHMAGAPEIVAHPPEPPKIARASLEALGPETPKRLSYERLSTIVAEAHPDMVQLFIQPPATAEDPVVFRGDRGEALVNFGANTVYVNPYSGEIMGQRLAEDWTAMQRVDAAMIPLHYGTWAKRGTADLIVKVIWFAGGAAMSFLAISGLIIYLKRTRRAAREVFGRSWLTQSALKFWRWIRPWGGPMGALKYLNILFLVGVAIGGALVLSLAGEGLDGKGRSFEAQNAGPFQIELTAIAGVLEADLPPIRDGARVQVLPSLTGARFEDARFVWIGVGDGSGPTEIEGAPGALMEGAEGLASARLKLPDTIDESHRLWATIEGWSGHRWAASWPLANE